MRTVVVRNGARIPLGKQGENNAVRVVWPGIAESTLSYTAMVDLS